jgi:hypothetical protein
MDHHHLSQLKLQDLTLMMMNKIIKSPPHQLEVGSKRSTIMARLNKKRLMMEKLSKIRKMTHLFQLKLQDLMLMMMN